MGVITFVLLIAIAIIHCSAQCNMLPEAEMPSGFCASQWGALPSPRGITTAPNGDLIVLSQSRSSVYAMWDSNGDGISDDSEQTVLASASGLNHAVAIHDKYLYASSPLTVYRWAYSGQRKSLGNPEIVVHSMPCCHHGSRPLAFDSQGHLYVVVGSASNVDQNTTHARIHKFTLPDKIPAGGLDWDEGTIYANGLRNEVGITFDKSDRLWGVENGVDNLFRADLGGDIHNNNPCEEVNFFPEAGKFYGYPYCWSEYSLPGYGKGKGTQWAQPEFMNDGTHTDAWCQTPANVLKPVYCMGAHQAPLGIAFYYGKSFPAEFTNGAFVALHGSWDRTPPQGYRVLFLTLDKDGMPVSETPFLQHKGDSAPWPNKVRPVSLSFAKCSPSSSNECLYVTSDANDMVIKISYSG